MSVGWGQWCGDVIEIDSIEEICNLTDLSEINLSESNLTGEIPSCIGNLVNLTCLNLSSNQLTGEIPSDICNLNLEWGNGFYDSNIYNNQLCPPYPECIEDYIGYQDTSECLECSETLGDLNNDMIVNVLDITTIVNCIVSDDICDDCYDISGDGIINVIDIISIVNIIIND